MDTLLIFFLNRSILYIVEKKLKTGFFLIREFLPFLYINLEWGAQNFKLWASYIRNSDWFNFIQFLGYKYKIRLVSILRKRENQALISISTILKLSAQVN